MRLHSRDARDLAAILAAAGPGKLEKMVRQTWYAIWQPAESPGGADRVNIIIGH